LVKKGSQVRLILKKKTNEGRKKKEPKKLRKSYFRLRKEIGKTVWEKKPN